MNAAQSGQPDSLKGPLSALPCQSMHEEPYMTRMPQYLHRLHNSSGDFLLGPARVLSHGLHTAAAFLFRHTVQLMMVTDQRTSAGIDGVK